jgi:hypothetical protein
MSVEKNEPIPGTSVTPQQVLEVCRTNVEALHNLKFLMNANLTDAEAMATYLEIMDKHLQNMTNELCRKL